MRGVPITPSEVVCSLDNQEYRYTACQSISMVVSFQFGIDSIRLRSMPKQVAAQQYYGKAFAGKFVLHLTIDGPRLTCDEVALAGSSATTTTSTTT